MANVKWLSVFVPVLFVFFQQQPWESKVDPTLLQAAEAGDKIAFLVVLQAQADVSGAKSLKSKDAKGRFVFNQLKQTARTTQQALINIIEGRGVSYQSFFIVNAILTSGDYELLRALAQHPATARIEPNPWSQMQQPVHTAEDEENALQMRNAIEWGIQRIRAHEVWALGYTGQDVVIGGQDTGYEWNHPALRNQYRGWLGDSVSHHYNWHDAIRTLNPQNDTTINNPCGLASMVPCDDNNHGTHTMGTMVGDDGQGNQIGVAPGAKWIACRNMERGWGTPATYIECFEWFLAPTDLSGANPDPERAPHVINNSWGCPSSEGCNAANWATMNTVVSNLKAAGIVVVVSAGNSGSGCGTVNTPAAMFEESFSVGATRNTDTIASFSSRGAVSVDGSNRLKPDISAPGVGIRSAIRNGNFASFSGTSMAGPHVAGLVALIISANPALAGQVDDIESIIEQTALTMLSTQNCGGFSGMESPNPTYGHGRIDALAAVQWVLSMASNTQSSDTEASVNLFPNPGQNIITITTSPQNPPLALALLSSSGVQVQQYLWPDNLLEQQSINISALPAGVYVYRLQTKSGFFTGKIIKL
jgi:serine protease AprX